MPQTSEEKKYNTKLQSLGYKRKQNMQLQFRMLFSHETPEKKRNLIDFVKMIIFLFRAIKK